MTEVTAYVRYLGPGGIEEEHTLELEIGIPGQLSNALLEGRVMEFGLDPKYTDGVKYVLHSVSMRGKHPLIEMKPAAQ